MTVCESYGCSIHVVISRNVHVVYLMRRCSFVHYHSKAASIYKLKWHLYKSKNIRWNFDVLLFMVHFPFPIIFYWPTYPSPYVDIHAITPMTWYKLPQFAGIPINSKHILICWTLKYTNRFTRIRIERRSLQPHCSVAKFFNIQATSCPCILCTFFIFPRT